MLYLIAVMPDAAEPAELDRGLGEVLRYGALFRAETANEQLDGSAVHLAVAMPTVPEPYRDIADHHEIELLEIRAALGTE